MNLFVFSSAFKAIFTNLHVIGRYGPTTQGSLYTGQDHDGQVTLFSGIQQWTVPYTGVVTTEQKQQEDTINTLTAFNPEEGEQE